MVSCQEPSPLKGSKHSLQCHPHDVALRNALSFVSMGVEAKCCPCHCAANHRHMKRQPSLCRCQPCRGHCHCNHRCCLHCSCHLHLCLLPSPLPSPIAVAVAVGHCHRGCHCLSLPPSPSCFQQPLPLLLPSPLAIAVSVTVCHCSPHLCWPSPLPSLLAIAKSCCLGAAKIVFEQFKQIMLTLFYFVWTVGGALIKAG